MFTVRSDNWNEKLGVVKAEDVAVVAGSGAVARPVTLRTVLQQLGQYGGYAGLEGGTNLYDSSLDAKCSIRFQTTFIPVQEPTMFGLFGSGKSEFATEAYNYNTMDDSDPRNLVLLCTSQGMAVQQDGRGAKKLFHHAVDGSGKIHRYWLEAEESLHKVGGAQQETAEERAEALARGKATSSVIGIRAMGQRFNVLMTIQVPLQQAKVKARSGCLSPWSIFAPSVPYAAGGSWGAASVEVAESDEWSASLEALEAKVQTLRSCSRNMNAARPVGHSSAARVSRGSEYDTWPGLSVNSPKRNPSEHVTVTVVLYNTVSLLQFSQKALVHPKGLWITRRRLSIMVQACQVK